MSRPNTTPTQIPFPDRGRPSAPSKTKAKSNESRKGVHFNTPGDVFGLGPRPRKIVGMEKADFGLGKRRKIRHNLQALQNAGFLTDNDKSSSRGIMGEDEDADDEDSARTMEENDPLKSFMAAQAALISQKDHDLEWLEEELTQAEEKDRLRLQRLRKSRGPKFTFFLDFMFHTSIIFIFLLCWVDSFKLFLRDSKFQAYQLQGIFNCLWGVATDVSYFRHLLNILLALMCTCALFAESRKNASLLMGFLFMNVGHTVFILFQYFIQLRFRNGVGHLKLLENVLIFTTLCLIASLSAIQRYYDLTDRIRERGRSVAANHADVKDGSLNEEVIYRDLSSFLQRKTILREAMVEQTFRVIEKMEHYQEKGISPDWILLYKELQAAVRALKDVDGVENEELLKELRKANAKRLKEIETNPEDIDEKTLEKLKKGLELILQLIFPYVCGRS